VSLAVGAVGVGVGGVFGIMTLRERSELKENCPSDVCAPGSQDSIDSAKRLGNVSTIGFGIGAAGLVLGSVLFFTAGDSSTTQDALARPRRKLVGLVNPRASIGPTRIQLAADF
jgi:hypothetical protein